MSHDDVESVHALNEAFNSAPDDVESWVEHYHPEIEFRMPPEWPEDSVYHGYDGIAQLTHLWTESFDEYRWDEEDVIDAGDCVVGLWRHRGRLKGSDAWVEREVGGLCYFRDGKIARLLCHFSWADALEAAGLPPREG